MYAVWQAMKERCYNPRNRMYPNYGGRGIVVCDRWKTSFEAFLADMGNRPSNFHSIDRIDNDGNYEPDNCRWATIDIQANNRRNNTYITWQGETLTTTEWGKRIGLSHSTISARLRKGWSIERIMTESLGQQKRHCRITFEGQTLSFVDWERKTGIPASLIQSRIRRLGWTIERALTQPVGKRFGR